MEQLIQQALDSVLHNLNDVDYQRYTNLQKKQCVMI